VNEHGRLGAEATVFQQPADALQELPLPSHSPSRESAAFQSEAGPVATPLSVSVLRPAWAAPRSVRALMSTRQGGVSVGAFAGLNLGLSVGDEPAAVQENARRLRDELGLAWYSPHLVHGAEVVQMDAGSPSRARPKADACWSMDPRLAVAVTAADCLPVLFSSPDGRAVAAAHAGWRGLAAGVLQNTVQALCTGHGCAPSELHTWLGACIGPQAFEVGADVLQAFGIEPAVDRTTSPHFVPATRLDGTSCWHADLPALARQALLAAGVRRISGGQWCTVAEPSRFFSFRRDGRTGRMLAAIACSAEVR
jgi:polyphenol oxidase